ncbi:MAG: RHS repeat-associated core domain-containing protein [Verrucomicrobia bacterium]|nr:RHS repeat-associated core domain-containing protein [Verrucomicrobiota bacterium]
MNTTRTTAFTYNADGKLLTLTARNSVTGDQVTRFVYGTTLDDSDIAGNELLRAKIYPDSDDNDDLTDGNDGIYDRVEYCYNRLGEMIEAKNQAGTIHAYDYDKLGRLIHDRVTSLGSGVDNAVLRISREYEVRGMLSKVTSYDNATVGSGIVVNEVELAYNDFAQLATDKQAHGGAVGSETPVVGCDYADGSDNTVRPTGITYPDSRALAYHYGTSGEMDDVLSRIAGIKEDTNTRAAYTRLGLNQVVNLSYPEPDVDMTFIAQNGEPVGDAGDQYSGLDRFSRVEDIRWIKSANHLERVQHGYDRASNKRWRKNLVAASGQDEFYNYDGLYQLTELQRGNLNNNRTTISSIPAKQEDFAYDPTGNWQNYLTKVAGAVSLDQNRTHNKANETWQIDGSNAVVGLDPAGNMVKMPKVGDWSTAQQLTWDAWNRLVKIAEGETVIAEYAYDALFRRTKKMVSGNTRHFYYSSQWQIVEERLGNSTPADRQFVWGLLGIDDLVLRDRFTSGSERLYAIHDTMHVTAIVDAGGDVQERYGYDAFGLTHILSPNFYLQASSAFDWETRFCGYRWDDEPGLYQVRYRYLHSGLGRWLSRDPVDRQGELNLYSYVTNTPTVLIDTSGRMGGPPPSPPSTPPVLPAPPPNKPPGRGLSREGSALLEGLKEAVKRLCPGGEFPEAACACPDLAKIAIIEAFKSRLDRCLRCPPQDDPLCMKALNDYERVKSMFNQCP